MSLIINSIVRRYYSKKATLVIEYDVKGAFYFSKPINKFRKLVRNVSCVSFSYIC